MCLWTLLSGMLLSLISRLGLLCVSFEKGDVFFYSKKNGGEAEGAL
jgi:hypothetical protein